MPPRAAAVQLIGCCVEAAHDLAERLAATWLGKEGIADDYANREDIAALLRFATTDKIYHVVVPTAAAAATSPHLEACR